MGYRNDSSVPIREIASRKVNDRYQSEFPIRVVICGVERQTVKIYEACQFHMESLIFNPLWTSYGYENSPFNQIPVNLIVYVSVKTHIAFGFDETHCQLMVQTKKSDNHGLLLADDQRRPWSLN